MSALPSRGLRRDAAPLCAVEAEPERGGERERERETDCMCLRVTPGCSESSGGVRAPSLLHEGAGRGGRG